MLAPLAGRIYDHAPQQNAFPLGGPLPLMDLRTRRPRADLTWGIGYGMAIAALFSVWVLIATAGRADEVAGKYGLSPVGIVGSYFASGGLAGALVGFFRPATQYRFGAFLVGSAAGTLVYGAAAFAMTGVLETSDFVIAAILGTFVGGGIADSQFHDRKKKEGSSLRDSNQAT